MNKKKLPHFIVIDDDPINNLICRKNIENLFSDTDIQTFTDPQEGVNYICSQNDTSGEHNTILFLDINMPILSGWEVLDALVACRDIVKSKFSIFILSSSIATKDRQEADDYSIVKGFVVKPLTKPELQKCVSLTGFNTAKTSYPL